MTPQKERKLQVAINRGGTTKSFTGTIKNETTSHYLVTYDNNKQEGEWFAKKSSCCNCTII